MYPNTMFSISLYIKDVFIAEQNMYLLAIFHNIVLNEHYVLHPAQKVACNKVTGRPILLIHIQLEHILGKK